jgi:hypothetical protein
LPVRRALLAAADQGASTVELASRFSLPARTVRHLLRRARANDGQPTAAAYPCGPRARPDSPVFDAAQLLKHEHPDWGARFLLGVLADSHPEDTLPSERTLRRWLQGTHVPAPPGRRPQRLPRASKPHRRWQVDAADQMRLLDGSDLSWLKGMDECSGAALGTVLFPPRAVQPGAGP